MSEDYPFTSWNSYYVALTRSLVAPDSLSSEYPRYAEEKESDNQADYRIMNDFLAAGLSPQEGLEGFIRAFVDAAPVISEFITVANAIKYFDYEVPQFMTLFMCAGANPETVDSILKPRYSGYEFNSVDCIYGMFVSRSKDWKDIKETDYPLALYMVLNFHSVYPLRMNPHCKVYDPDMRFQAIRMRQLHKPIQPASTTALMTQLRQLNASM